MNAAPPRPPLQPPRERHVLQTDRARQGWRTRVPARRPRRTGGRCRRSSRGTDLVRALLDERDLRLRYILRTHIHDPDRADSAALCEITGAQTAVGEHAPPCGLPPSRCKRLVHGDTLVFGNELVRVLSTPGHTPGRVSYLWRDRLFCGDVFDVGSCVTGNQEADAGLLFDSLTRRILHLPDETLIFPAHGIHGRTISTMSEQRKRLVQLSERSREAFVTEMAFKRLTRPKLDEPFTPTRSDG